MRFNDPARHKFIHRVFPSFPPLHRPSAQHATYFFTVLSFNFFRASCFSCLLILPTQPCLNPFFFLEECSFLAGVADFGAILTVTPVGRGPADDGLVPILTALSPSVGAASVSWTWAFWAFFSKEGGGWGITPLRSWSMNAKS